MNAIFLGLFLTALAQIFTTETTTFFHCVKAGLIAFCCVYALRHDEIGFYLALTTALAKTIATGVRYAAAIRFEVGERAMWFEFLVLPCLLLLLFYNVK